VSVAYRNSQIVATFRMLYTRDILLLSLPFAFTGLELAYW